MFWYGQDNAPNWQQCTPQTTSNRLWTRNNDPVNKVYSVSNNPYLSMPLGYYTNGTHNIMITSGNTNPLAGGIAFQTTLENMAMSHWSSCKNAGNPILTNIQNSVFTPITPECN